MAKGVLMFFSLITLSISIYLGLALSEEPISLKYLHVVPIFLTTLNSILATFALFHKLPPKIILWVSVVIVLAGLVNFVMLTLEPGALEFGWLAYVVFQFTEPPFFIPLLMFNAWIPYILWRTVTSPEQEISISDL